jgi:hypothetical protein
VLQRPIQKLTQPKNQNQKVKRRRTRLVSQMSPSSHLGVLILLKQVIKLKKNLNLSSKMLQKNNKNLSLGRLLLKMHPKRQAKFKSRLLLRRTISCLSYQRMNQQKKN